MRNFSERVCESALSSPRVMENWQIPIKLIPAATDFIAKKHRKMMAGSRGIFHVFFPAMVISF